MKPAGEPISSRILFHDRAKMIGNKNVWSIAERHGARQCVVDSSHMFVNAGSYAQVKMRKSCQSAPVWRNNEKKQCKKQKDQ